MSSEAGPSTSHSLPHQSKIKADKERSTKLAAKQKKEKKEDLDELEQQALTFVRLLALVRSTADPPWLEP